MTSISPAAATRARARFRSVLGMLWRDKFATAAVIFLAVAVLCALFGPALLGEAATKQNLRGRNAPPFDLEQGWLMLLGADALGRPLLARIVVAAQNTLMIAAGAVVLSASIGAVLGLVAGYGPRWAGTAIMRLADVIMSFPSLLLAVIVLYMLSPSVGNVILVLAITRIPIYLRTTRAEVLEIRERMFVQAAQVMGASSLRIVFRHILPMVIPTLVTIATLDFAFVMLAESALSFLGIGIQPPEITWGLMVAQGKQYLANAWWLAFWPGLAIILTTLSLNLLSNWLRIALDPAQRWRLEIAPRRRQEVTGRTCSKSATSRSASTPPQASSTRSGASAGTSTAARPSPSSAKSGSGKSVSASAIMNLIDCPPGEIAQRRGPVRRPRPADDVRRRAPRHQRQAHRHDLPGPAQPPEPGLHRRLAARGGDARARHDRGRRPRSARSS